MISNVHLHLGGHCIETASKKKLKTLMDQYFEDDAPEDVEEQIRILQEFMEQSDFSSLRSSDNRLAGEEEANVRLYRGADGKIVLDFMAQ
ncbi:MAG: hypothetical protein ACOCWZ_02865 [Spirochaetota bacterium]